MSKSDGRDQDTNLRVLISQSAISRRKFLLASMSSAAATALEAGARPAAAAGGSLTSLTYSGQRWGAVQEGMAPAFTKATGIDAKIITFPISQGYARILNALGVGSAEYDVIDIDYGVLAQVASKLTPLDDYLSKDPTFKADYEQSVSPNVRGLYQFDGSRLGKGYYLRNRERRQYSARLLSDRHFRESRHQGAAGDLGRGARRRQGAYCLYSVRQAVWFHHEWQARHLFFDAVWPGAVQLRRQLAGREQRSDSDHSGGRSRTGHDRKTDEIRRPERRQRRRQRDDQRDGLGRRGLHSERVGQQRLHQPEAQQARGGH